MMHNDSQMESDGLAMSAATDPDFGSTSEEDALPAIVIVPDAGFPQTNPSHHPANHATLQHHSVGMGPRSISFNMDSCMSYIKELEDENKVLRKNLALRGCGSCADLSQLQA